MKWESIADQCCSVARSMAILGDRWTILVLREAFAGRRRFEEFLEGVGASRAIIADRLTKLSEAGIFERVAYQEHPPRHEYRLTPKGTELLPVLLSLIAWGDKWLDDDLGPPRLIVHGSCGKPTRPYLSCSECGEPIGHDVRDEPGPGTFNARKPDPRWPKGRGRP